MEVLSNSGTHEVAQRSIVPRGQLLERLAVLSRDGRGDDGERLSVRCRHEGHLYDADDV